MQPSLRKFARLLRYALREWPALAVILALVGLGASLAALLPWPIKIMVDCAIGGQPLPPALTRLADWWGIPTGSVPLLVLVALGSLSLFAVQSALDAALTWAWYGAGQRLVYDLAADFFQQLQRLSLLYHSRRSLGDSLSRLTGDTWCVYTVADSLLIAPVREVLTLVIITTVAWRLNPSLCVLTVVMAPGLALSAIVFGNRLTRRARLGREAQARLLSFVQQTLTAVPLVQAYSTEAGNRDRFLRLAADATDVARRETVVKGAFELLNGLVMTVATALVLVVGGRQVLAGQLTVGSLLVFLGYLVSLQGACRGLMGIYGGLRSVEASVDRLSEVLDARDRVEEAPHAVDLPAAPAGGRGRVRFEGVTYGYETGRLILRDLCFEMEPGETVALVGPTGAGKSTIAALVLRLYDPWQGRVLVDGVDVRGVKLASLRGCIGFLPQEAFLLPLSVARNIAYGRPAARRDEIIAAAVAAHADEFIRKLPDGYDTVLGERGTTLSLGQRQRLAIARALLRDAPILILDEPTSALDARTEAQVMDALGRLRRGRSALIIAHRLATVRQADRILVLQQGQIVETGNHDQLLAARGIYHKLYTQQFAAAVVKEALAP